LKFPCPARFRLEFPRGEFFMPGKSLVYATRGAPWLPVCSLSLSLSFSSSLSLSLSFSLFHCLSQVTISSHERRRQRPKCVSHNCECGSGKYSQIVRTGGAKSEMSRVAANIVYIGKSGREEKSCSQYLRRSARHATPFFASTLQTG
jgi:hypothetical protein